MAFGDKPSCRTRASGLRRQRGCG